MAGSTYTQKAVKRLYEARRCFMKQFKPHRDQHTHLVKAFIGHHFGEDGSPDKKPIPNFYKFVRTMLAQFAGRPPVVSIKSEEPGLDTAAELFMLAMNKFIRRELNLLETLEMTTVDAFFSPMAIVKVGLERRGSIEIDGFMHDYGQPFADPVDLDDFVFDLQARRWDKIWFAGDRYCLPLEDVKGSDDYENTDKLQSTDQLYKNDDGEDTIHTLSRGTSAFDEPYEDMVDLVDFWLPRDNVILTLPWCQEVEKPIREVDWEGPERGPYHRLVFNRVPGQVIGLPALSVLLDLDEISNTLYLKGARDAQDAKKNPVYRGDSEEDANRIRTAKNGEWIRADNPGGVNVVQTGGADQQAIALGWDAAMRFDNEAGNLSILGGLSPQAETAKQELLMNNNASMPVKLMQSKVIEFTTSILEDLGWYIWQDPMKVIRVSRPIEGIDKAIQIKWGPEYRTGDFALYNFEIAPHSMVLKTPGEEMDEILSYVMNVLNPASASGALAAQNLEVDYRRLTKEWASAKNLSARMKNIIIDLSPEQVERMGPVGKARQSPNTTRTNVRINRSGTTTQGKAADTIAQMMGANKQPSERGGMYRGVG